MPAMYLAGLPIPASDVLQLARLVDEPEPANRLESAYGRGARILALEIEERHALLRALEDGPPSAGVCVWPDAVGGTLALGSSGLRRRRPRWETERTVGGSPVSLGPTPLC
jgi:hypothetical protein